MFLEENTVPERRWACGLYRVLGSWEAVHQHAGYKKLVQPKLPSSVPSCGSWPPVGVICPSCGIVGGSE